MRSLFCNFYEFRDTGAKRSLTQHKSRKLRRRRNVAAEDIDLEVDDAVASRRQTQRHEMEVRIGRQNEAQQAQFEKDLDDAAVVMQRHRDRQT